jgi:CHAT domain-containing protein
LRCWGSLGVERRRAAAKLARWLGVVVSCVLPAACGITTAPVTLQSAGCVEPGAAGETNVTLASPGAGLLLVSVEERGLSIAARLDASPVLASSPVERLGTIDLLAPSAASQAHTLHLRNEDSADVQGSVCIGFAALPVAGSARTQAEAAFARAAVATHATQWEDAFAQYLTAARIFGAIGLSHQSALARQALAELAYRRFDRKRDSYALASAALQDFGKQEPSYVGALSELQAKALMDMPGGDLSQLAPEIHRRLRAARDYDRRSGFGTRELPRLDILKGTLDYNLNLPDRAVPIWSDAAQHCRALRDWSCYATATQNLGYLAEERNNNTLALSIYTDALRSLDPLVSPRLVADIQDNLGRLQGSMGLFNSSVRTHAAAMRAYAHLGDCSGFRRTLARAGSLLVQMGTLGDAEKYLEQASSLDCASLLANVADFADTAADITPVQERTELSREIQAESSTHDLLCKHPIDAASLGTDNQTAVFNALLSLGNALELEGEAARAQMCIHAAQAYATIARTRMRLENARGALLLDRSDASGARASFEQTLRIADEAKIAEGNEHRRAARLGVVKAAILSGNYTAALQGAEDALRASLVRSDIDQAITSLQLIASATRATKRPEEAAHALRVAIGLSEAVPIDKLDGEKRATYLATQHSVFTELTDLYASQAVGDGRRPWDAFLTSEGGRSRSLRYAESQTTYDAAPVAPQSARYDQLLHDVATLGSATHESTADLINALGAAATQANTGTEVPDRQQLDETLRHLDATLVEYSVGTRDMFAFVLSNGTLSVTKLGNRDEISDAAARLRDVLRDAESPESAVRSASQQLARLIVWPLRSQITARRIIIVPDDSLHTVPFSVLPWSSEPRSPLLVDRAETTIAPSAMFLTRNQVRSAEKAPRFALIGDPVFRISDWRKDCLAGSPSTPRSAAAADRAASDWTEYLPRLPGTRTEVSGVAKLARQTRPASHIETLLGCAAVADALRAAADGGAELLHIATHARVDAQRPRLSALALTPEAETGRATSAFGLLDILGLKLKSRLVVLSACDTSRGRLLPGEGVLGPAQAFLQAGSAAVLASYWRIDDATTASFMQRFYTHLLAQHQPVAAALRSAQLEAAHTSSAHTWAAFALYGWPDSSI